MSLTPQQVIEQCAHDSHAGTADFGDIVKALMQAGVESYQADYRVGRTTYYLLGGETHSIDLPVPAVEIPQAFNASAIQEAIRGAQSGQVKYTEFLERSMSAGCVGYTVWIAGQHVSYFGRLGQVHVERFPGAN